MSINYAQYQEIQSLPAAIVFAAVYVPLFLLNVIQSTRVKSRVYFVLSFFCLLRIVAFSLRSALAGSDSAAHNENLFIAEQVFYYVGFFGIVSSAYTLCLDRQILANTDRTVEELPGPFKLLMRLMRSRRLIHIALLAAVVCGIVAIVEETQGSTSEIHTGTKLRHASIIIFLVIIIILVIQVVLLSCSTLSQTPGMESPRLPPSYFEYTSTKAFVRGESGFGAMQSSFVLMVMAALLLAREAFFAATYDDLSKQDQETLWYPLSAGTELLTVILFAIPGLVPPRDDRFPAESRRGIVGLAMRGVGAGSHNV